MLTTKKYDSAKYLDISQDHLVVTALWLLLKENQQPSFENLVAMAFTCFPERFQLEGYPQWPNSHVIGKAWVRCRTDKKWMMGSASEGFQLTPLGEQIARNVISKLENVSLKKTKSQRKGSKQSISSRVVLRVEKSPAYKTFTQAGIEKVSEYEFCDLLYCTLESIPETFGKNFVVVKQEVEKFGRADLLEFLERLKEKFAGKFIGKRVRGGLMPQKREE